MQCISAAFSNVCGHCDFDYSIFKSMDIEPGLRSVKLNYLRDM
jgi:hypothetical protein